MIKINYTGRLGNKIFQYTFGRILAEEKNYYLDAIPLPGFQNTKQTITGKKLPITKKISGQLHNLNELINYNGGIESINANFERYEYYKPYKSKIKNWLETKISKELINRYNISDDDCIIHLRMGDVWNKKIGINYEDAIKMLKQLNFKNLYICSDDFKNINVQKIQNKFNGIFVYEDVFNTYNIIKRFNKIVLSPSTFSWWAAWLSDANEIYLPWKKDGIRWSDKWTKKRGLDLRVDEPRYKTVILD